MRRVLPLFTLLSGFALGLSLLSAPGCGEPTATGCQKDTDCREPRVCDYDTGRCVSPDGTCEIDDDCPGEGWRCAPSTGTCTDPECEADAACGEGRYCDLQAFTCYDPECETAADCGETGYNCENLKCVERECETDVECHPGVCEVEQGVCLDCMENADCNAGEVCVNDTCIAQESCLETSTACEPNRYSDPEAGAWPTTSYAKLLLRNETDTRPQVEGTAPLQPARIGGVADYAYWPVGGWTLTSSANLEPVSLFGNSTEVRVDRLFQIVDATGAPLGDPILEAAPYTSAYSPVHRVVKVEAPAGYVPNTIRSEATLRKALQDPGVGLVELEETVPEVRLIPVVAEAVDLYGTIGAPGEPIRVEMWHAGQRIWGYQLPSSHSDTLPILSPDPISPLKMEGWLFYTDRSGCPWTLLERPFGDDLYTPLVQVSLVRVASCADADLPASAGAARAGLNDGTYTLIDQVWTLMPQQP